jgi:hypothetical protein
LGLPEISSGPFLLAAAGEGVAAAGALSDFFVCANKNAAPASTTMSNTNRSIKKSPL